MQTVQDVLYLLPTVAEAHATKRAALVGILGAALAGVNPIDRFTVIVDDRLRHPASNGVWNTKHLPPTSSRTSLGFDWTGYGSKTGFQWWPPAPNRLRPVRSVAPAAPEFTAATVVI